MKASDPEVKAALAMQTLWRALCARRALTLARRRAASDQMAWQRQLIASVERERQEEEAARFVQNAYRAAVRRKRLNLVRKRAAEHAEQKRKQELAERQQAFRDAREKRKREAATSFDPAAAEKVTAEREARAKRDRLVAAEPARVKGRGVGAVVGAVLGERRARIAGGVLQIDGLPPSGAQQVALNGTLNPTPLDARAGEFSITVGGAVVVLKAAGAEAMQAWIDVLSEEAPPPAAAPEAAEAPEGGVPIFRGSPGLRRDDVVMHGCKHCTLVSEVRADVTTPGPKHDKYCPRYTPVVTVRVPDGVSGGDAMQVPTAKGAMAVTVPAGLVTADTFAMQLPRNRASSESEDAAGPSFGAPLAAAAARADAVPLPGGGAVPRVAAVLVERLHGGRDGGGRPFLEAEGLFRAPGEKAEVDDLAAALDGGDAIGAAAACADPLVLASCLKLYLRKLPEPLVPYAAYAAFVDGGKQLTSAQHVKKEAAVAASAKLAASLRARVADASAAHVELYELLLSLFAEIVAIPSNRMAPNALATCLAPALLRPAPGRRLSAEEEMADMRPIGAALTAVISNGVARPAGAKLDLTTTAPPPPLDAGERTPDDGPAPPGLRVVSADASSVSLSISGASRLDPDGGWRVGDRAAVPAGARRRRVGRGVERARRRPRRQGRPVALHPLRLPRARRPAGDPVVRPRQRDDRGAAVDRGGGRGAGVRGEGRRAEGRAAPLVWPQAEGGGGGGGGGGSLSPAAAPAPAASRLPAAMAPAAAALAPAATRVRSASGEAAAKAKAAMAPAAAAMAPAAAAAGQKAKAAAAEAKAKLGPAAAAAGAKAAEGGKKILSKLSFERRKRAPAADGASASTDATSPAPAAAPSGGKPAKRVLSFGRKAKAPAPAPADGPASTDAASPPPAAAPSGGKPQKRVLSFGRKPKKAAEPAVDMESEAAL